MNINKVWFYIAALSVVIAGRVADHAERRAAAENARSNRQKESGARNFANCFAAYRTGAAAVKSSLHFPFAACRLPVS